MKLTERIDLFLFIKWQWSDTEIDRKFWIKVTGDFFLFLRMEKIKDRNLEDDPVWNVYFDKLKAVNL